MAGVKRRKDGRFDLGIAPESLQDKRVSESSTP
jgi:hypothetical protein